MSAIAHGARLLRHIGHDANLPGLALAVALGPLVAMGWFAPRHIGQSGLLHIVVLVAYVAVLARALVRELAGKLSRHATRVDLELGCLLLVGAYMLCQATGGQHSPLHPFGYAVLGPLVVIASTRSSASLMVGTAVLLELALAAASHEPRRWTLALYGVVLVGLFAVSGMLVLSSMVRRMRTAHQNAIETELRRMRQEARDFRLIASQLPLGSRSRTRDEEELKIAQGAVQSIHEQLFHTVDLMRSAMSLHTTALLWVSDFDPASSGPTMRLTLKEFSTHSEHVREQAIVDRPGVLAALLRDPKPLRLKALAGKRVPPYYAAPAPVTDLCAVPVMAGHVLRGILCADRVDDRPFSDLEEHTLIQAAEQLVRVVDHERVFAAVERGKYEQEQFYRASELLNQALTLEQVYESTFTALRALVGYDLAVFTGHDPSSGNELVLAVDHAVSASEATRYWSELGELLRGRTFQPAGSIAMAVKNRHYMPRNGELLDPDTAGFDSATRVRRAKSMLVLPLSRGDHVLGTLVLLAERAQLFSEPLRELLRVISHQVAVSLQNARMYRAMEERATTDGLTGLTNHRAFQERFAHLHALAERSNRQFSLILTDIDHFKSINDTYGHPVGDQVLKRVAALFSGRARKVDIVARYGGEEFVLVLPDTDGEGAELFADRLRQDIAERTIVSEHGSFHVTISMGVAEYPSDGRERRELIEHADQALYYCKEHGRNRVQRWATLA